MRAQNSYQGQRYQARRRGIPFLLTFDEWYNWWLQQGVDKNQPSPPKSSSTLCMCRIADVGPYALNNIYCADVSTNVKHQRQNMIIHAGPKGKKIMTPDGIFSSRKDAAKFYGIEGSSLGDRMKRYPKQYYYL